MLHSIRLTSITLIKSFNGQNLIRSLKTFQDYLMSCSYWVDAVNAHIHQSIHPSNHPAMCQLLYPFGGVAFEGVPISICIFAKVSGTWRNLNKASLWHSNHTLERTNLFDGIRNKRLNSLNSPSQTGAMLKNMHRMVGVTKHRSNYMNLFPVSPSVSQSSIHPSIATFVTAGVYMEQVGQ